MAFNLDNFGVLAGQGKRDESYQLFSYKTTDDDSTMLATGYFVDLRGKVSVNDVIAILKLGGATVEYVYYVVTIAGLSGNIVVEKVQLDLSNELPLGDSDTANAGTSDFASRSDHQHPKVSATTTTVGQVELATQTETEAGTLTNRAVTPASLDTTLARITTNESNIGTNATDIGTNATDIDSLETSRLQSVVGSDNITVDNTDSLNPIISVEDASTTTKGVNYLNLNDWTGLVPSSNSVTPDEQIDITAGKVPDSTGSEMLVVDADTLDITDSTDWASGSVPAIVDEVPTMTSDSQDGFVASASKYATGANPYKAFNNNSGDIWLADGVQAGWLQIQLPIAKTIIEYTITSRDATYSTQSPKNFTLQASNTGAWGGEEVTLDTQTDQTGWTGYETRGYTISNSTAYLYYRLVVTSTELTTDLSVAEFELSEVQGLESNTFYAFATPTALKLDIDETGSNITTTKRLIRNLKTDSNGDIITDEFSYSDNADYVVESYIDGYSWYRKYRNGWIEQGGRETVAVNSIVVVTLPITYPNVHMLAVATYNEVSVDIPDGIGAQATSTSTITLRNSASFIYTLNWISKGY